MAGFDIPSIEKLDDNKSRAASALYGVGISLAVFREKANKNNPGTSYNVPNLINTPNFDPDAQKDASGAYRQSSRWSGMMSSSLQGMPVMSYLKFIGGVYTDIAGNDVTIPDITFETVVMTVRMGKNIEKTKIQGRNDGSVKEFIGIGDWDVEVRAIITADAPVNKNITKRLAEGVYPRDNMAEIVKILKAPIALPIESWFLEQFQIRYLVIEEGVQIEQIEGDYNQQRIVLPCVSDNPLIIRVSNA